MILFMIKDISHPKTKLPPNGALAPNDGGYQSKKRDLNLCDSASLPLKLSVLLRLRDK